MSDTTSLGFPAAARRLGVPLWVLRHAIRSGKLPAPPQQGATATLPVEWLTSVQALVKASPQALSRTFAQKVPAFARFGGTSVWRKYSKRAREYARFRARRHTIDDAPETRDL